MIANEAPSIARTGTLQNYNAAVDLIERNLAARPDKIAYIDEHGRYSFAELAERVNRCAGALTGLVRRELTDVTIVGLKKPQDFEKIAAALASDTAAGTGEASA